MKTLISQEGKQMVLINVDAQRNSKKQFKLYMDTVEKVRNRVECVVSTSLPGEERVFWPYHDVQFYIRDRGLGDGYFIFFNKELLKRIFIVEN